MKTELTRLLVSLLWLAMFVASPISAHAGMGGCICVHSEGCPCK